MIDPAWQVRQRRAGRGTQNPLTLYPSPHRGEGKKQLPSLACPPKADKPARGGQDLTEHEIHSPSTCILSPRGEEKL